MDSSFWLAVGLAILASTLLNVGKGVQKWKVKVLGEKLGVFKPAYRKEFSLWLAGMGMTTLASPFFSLALKFSDKPSTVSALNGVGLIGLVLFAWLVIGESIGWRELTGAGLVIVGTAVMGFFDEPIPAQVTDYTGLIGTFVGFVGIIVPLALYSWKARRFHGLIFGALAGGLVGFSMTIADVALLRANNDFIGQLFGPTVYVALGVGTCALALTQVAFWRATAMVVVPTINSFIIFMPAVIQYFAFGTLLAPLQFVGIGIVVGGVILLTSATPGPAPEPISGPVASDDPESSAEPAQAAEPGPEPAPEPDPS